MRSKFFSSLVMIAGLSMLTGCATTKVALPQNKVITVDSEPRGAKVIFNGSVVCESTPGEVVVPLTYNTDNVGFKTAGKRAENSAKMNAMNFKFILPGYETAVETIYPNTNVWPYQYPDGVFHQFTPENKVVKSISSREPEERVTRENPGATKMEDSVIRWYFDSDPRGARIFWRVISSVPSEVKNTNETYLTTTPYEETRGFNILGLTYANSKDVTIEIKVSKRGYMDQVKRFNVRQALDQQEISGFFELVHAD